MIKDYTTNPEYFGYYDEPGQHEPAYDPGNTAPCLLCGQPWTDDTVRTITFVRWSPPKADKCFFYRVHKACHSGMGSDEQRREFEGRMFDSTE